MWLRQAANYMEKGLSAVFPVVGNIGAGVIALMMMLTVADIIGRRFLSKPVSGTYELSEFLLVIVVFFSIAHCEFLKGHITVDLAVSRLQPKTQDIVNSIMYLFFLVMFCLLTWQLYLHGMKVWRNGLESGILGVPVSPFVFVAALGCCLLSLVVLTHLLLFLAGALRK